MFDVHGISQEGTRCFVQLRRDDLDTRFPQLMATLLSVAAADGVGRDVTVDPGS
jgi:hypothetical protein